MNVVTACPICGSKKSFALFTAENYPFFTVPVKKEDKKVIQRQFSLEKLSGPLQPVVCEKCGHIYLEKNAPEEIIAELYSKYYNYPSAISGGFTPVRDDNFIKIFIDDILKKLEKSQRDLLEIGCYDGYILHSLKNNGFKVMGCDPSIGADIGQARGIDIKKQFFKVEDFVKNNLTYDVVVFRHFLEHVTKPVDFLKSIKRILRDDSMIVFEVPNVEFYLKSGGTTVFSFQHVHYFSEASISRLMVEAGFKVIELIKSEDNLIVAAKKGKTTKAISAQRVLELSKEFQTQFTSRKVMFKEFLDRLVNKPIFLWGAGGFSCNVMEVYEMMGKEIKGIVDSDKNKWGMEFLKHSIAITDPAVLKKEEQGGVIVCSMYSKEILNTLKLLHYPKPVINFFPNLEFVRSVNE